MSTGSQDQHPIFYDGKTSELYKIYALSIMLSILTVGIYHFWGKTRKRRYITSSFMLDKDRFEYTGYGSELLVGLMLGVILLIVCALPLIWATEEIENFNLEESTSQKHEAVSKKPDKVKEEKQKTHHIEQQDPFKKNKIVAQYTSLTNFWIQFNEQGVYVKYKEGLLDIKWRIEVLFIYSMVDVQFIPKDHIPLAIAVFIIPFYFVFFFVWLPFVIVYGSLRYRATRLRWRGIRGHLEGSALLYGIFGLMHTVMKVITVGFWIPIGDVMMGKYKLNKLYFGNQKSSFDIGYKELITVNLATIGASAYLVLLTSIMGYFTLPLIVQLAPEQGWLVEKFIFNLLKEGYYLTLILLIWVCYIPRYWYRAFILRVKYNFLRFGNIGFVCNASGYDYFKLFVINDLIFIFSLTLGLPLIWQRRMAFFCKHVQVTGNVNELNIEQAPGKKTKFGGGFASVMNLEIGLI